MTLKEERKKMINAEINTMKTKSIKQKMIICDGHCDTIEDIINHKRLLGEKSSIGHLDIPRMKEGGVNVQNFAMCIWEDIYTPDRGLKRILELIDCLFSEIEKNSEDISIVTNYHQIEEVMKAGKIAAIPSVEGGEALEGNLAILRVLYRLGIRLMTLTWNHRNQIADGIGEARTNGGLTEFGIKLIDEMNRLGMLIDVSHISESGFWDVMKRSKFPIIATHSNCYTLCSHPRNLKDTQIKALADKGGFIGVAFVPDFLTKDKRETNIEDVLDHIDYLVKIGGVDCVGLGSDFDGTKSMPLNLEGADKMPNITKGLFNRGYKEKEIKKILGENFLRIYKEVVG